MCQNVIIFGEPIVILKQATVHCTLKTLKTLKTENRKKKTLLGVKCRVEATTGRLFVAINFGCSSQRSDRLLWKTQSLHGAAAQYSQNMAVFY